MKVKGFNHLTLNISSLDQSIHFYENILGCKLVHKGRMDCYLEWGEAWICLQERVELSPLSHQLGVDHIAFFIEEDEFHKAVQKLRVSQVPIVRGPLKRGGGWTINFLDPDGIQFELHTATLQKRMADWT
ncbi:metallothiol transferase [Bacillus pakistanensis]|uniref:Metallothiol transferase n=1 Tax=Rossellomorea pakistanensis TaxID=992288 RepID=A0ABS2NF31_9BACI|nr:VOC family protein [Bacillus pakistanensis]MBM7586468.1 metallothiol transferase [Bacillus pakistanensis]